MNKDTYRNAMNHLRYSDDLEQKVMAAAQPCYLRIRIVRLVAVTTIICLLLGVGAYAAVNEWLRADVTVDDVGGIDLDLSDAKVLQFTTTQSMEGISVHVMSIGTKNISCRNGYIYVPMEGFFWVDENYEMIPVEYQTVMVRLEKNGREYTRVLLYVLTEDDFVSNMGTFKIRNGQILINAFSSDQWAWPVYLNVYTGEFRDAMPDLDEDDFELNVAFAEQYRDGYIVSTIDSRINGKARYMYWVSGDCTQILRLDLPEKGVDESVVNGIFYYKDRANGHYYYMDEEFQFHRMEEINRTGDFITKGLLAYSGDDGTLEIADLAHGVIYNITDISVNEDDVSDIRGWSATRNSADGCIMVYRMDPFGKWVTFAVLDQNGGVLKQLSIDSAYEINGYGWLDDQRFWIIYSDDTDRYLCVYDFSCCSENE